MNTRGERQMKKRSARLKRKTKETDISVEITLDGSGNSSVNTGIGFLDHMLELLARHSLMDLTVRAKGDLAVDCHHTVEDIGLCLGQALDRALGTRNGIARYGWSLVPMDDALSRAAVDLGGRPYLVFETKNRARRVGNFDVSLVRELLQAFCVQGRLNLHVAQLYGREAHHAYESVFKALAKALRLAWTPDPRVKGIPSSKGRL